MAHRFGSTWTELKLDVIQGYLDFYTKVLKDKPSPASPFRLWYVDAFAGTGSRTVEVTTGGIFEDRPQETEEVELDGSARRALRIDIPFHKYVFIEGDGGRFEELSGLPAEFPERDIVCLPGDANERLTGLFRASPWRSQRGGRGEHRAVVFLDPYGLSVKWSTLQLLAETGAVDVWYLFPLEAVNRQLTGDLSRVEEYKQVKLDEIFGTPDWRSELYASVTNHGLFGGMFTQNLKTVRKPEIEAYALSRFRTLFSYVSAPIPITGHGRGQIFSLICMSNSSSHAATSLIKKGVDWLHQRYAFASASRRT